VIAVAEEPGIVLAASSSVTHPLARHGSAAYPVLIEAKPLTFEVRDGRRSTHVEFGIVPTISGREETRSIVLDGDRLILGNPGRGTQYEWQRVQ
jgi:hypothetical protein